MKNVSYFDVEMIAENDMQWIDGGQFSYDFAFAIREFGVYVSNGGGMSGQLAVATDLALNYRPKNG